MMNKIALVTGASGGIGAMTAKELAKAGFAVYAAAPAPNAIHFACGGAAPVAAAMATLFRYAFVAAIATVIRLPP